MFFICKLMFFTAMVITVFVLGAAPMTSRLCGDRQLFPRIGCEARSIGSDSVEICVCDTEFCNGA